MGLFSNKRGERTLSTISKSRLKELNFHLLHLIEKKLWLQIIIGMFFGILVGVLLGPSMGILEERSSEILGEWLALPGYFFLAMIQMIVVPLVFASVMRGVTSGGSMNKLKKQGLFLLFYFLIISAVAVVIGLLVGTVVAPGSYIDPNLLEGSVDKTEIKEEMNNNNGNTSLKEMPKEIVSIIPTNPLSSMLNSKMLQVVILAFIFGFALLSLSKKESKPVLDLLESIQSISMKIVKWVMHIAPLAVFGLLAKVTMNTGLDVLYGLSVYVVSVIIGLFILMLFFLLIVYFMGRKNPYTFMRYVKEPLLMAFSTDSSAAVIPLSIKTAQEKLKVKPSIAQFVIPIGATVNMSGTALYQGLATLFMSQIFGVDLPLSLLLALIVTAVGASIGTPATPGVGIIILSSVLTSTGIPLAGIPLILGVDRILEMSRAVLNVAGDLTACVTLDRFVKKHRIS